MNKQRILLFAAVALLMIATACGGFSNRGTLERPLIGSANNSNLSFTQIELTDSSTVIQGVVRNEPGWWVRIAPTSEIRVNGASYPLQQMEGMALGEQVVMPDSGVIHFSMTFPAIPADAKTLDFSENADNGWALWDIDLTGKAGHDFNLKKVPSKARKDAGRELPATAFAPGDTAVINIHILGYRPEMGNKLTWVANTLHGQIGADTPVEVDENGNAELKLSLSSPSLFMPINLDKGVDIMGSITVAPGENLNVYLDSHTSGLRNMLARDGGDWPEDYRSVYSDGLYPKLQRKVMMGFYSGDFCDYHWTGDQYTDYVIGLYDALNDSIASDSSLSDVERRFNKASLSADLITAAAEGRSLVERNYYIKTGQPWGSPIPADTIIMELSPENVKAIAAKIDFNDPDMMLSQEITTARLKPEFWENAGVDAGLLKTIGVYKRAYEAAENGALADADTASLPAPLAEDVKAHNAAVISSLEALGESIITPAPDVAPDKLIEAIVAPHKGKVVMIDLWNTWCGPCRSAIADIEPEKSGDLSSDDIVWVYIANHSSPKLKYIQMANGIKGIHYRVDAEQWDAICDRFGVDGIPFYILVDRDGRIQRRPDIRNHSLYKQALLTALSPQ